MSDLTPEADKLVRAGRAALRPSDADRARVFQALSPKLDGSAGAEMSAPSRAPAAAKATVVKAGALLVGLGVAGAGLFFMLRPEPPPTTRTLAVARASSEPASRPALASPADETPKSAGTATLQAPAAEKRATVTPRSADSLAQEVAILSRAGAELHAGRPQAALTALDEHQRKFPSGVLTQERTAARVQALCALGRTNEAQAELARLARTSPNSPHEARARKACGSALTRKK